MVGHVAGFAVDEVFAKDLVRVAAHAAFHEKARKVRAREQIGIAGVAQGAFVCALDAGFFQPGGHFFGARAAPAPVGRQAARQGRLLIQIEAQADDVHGIARVADGNFHPGEVAQAVAAGGLARAGLGADFVVVGQ